MATYTLEQYREVQKRRLAALKKNSKKSSVEAARFTAIKARLYAPQKTGRLRRGIVRRQNVVTARASDSRTGFPYIHWVNQTPGAKMTTLRARNYKDRNGTPVVSIGGSNWVKVPGGNFTYGLQPNWGWTGRAMFFQLATAEGRQLNKRLAVKANRKSIQVKT